jgi:hypothetical protein
MTSTRALIVRGRRCACDCDGNGVLVYLSCPKCEKVVLVCDEIGNVFDNIDDPLASSPLVIWRSAGQRCSGCHEVLLADFRISTEHDLTGLGLGSDEVEAGDAVVSDSVRRLATD